MTGWSRVGVVAASGALFVSTLCATLAQGESQLEVGPADRITANLRQLDPYGRLTEVGNFPAGAALTPDGRFYWTASAGYDVNGVQIVSVETGDVIQTLPLPGTSGGVAIDGANHRAYVSGQPNTDIEEFKPPPGTPGGGGDVIHVFDYSPETGEATHEGVIDVPPPATAPFVDAFPPTVPRRRQSWPERLAVSPDGSILLAALGLADHAAVIETETEQVRYVPTGSHPFGAAILPDGRTGLISNRGGQGASTVSVIDLPDARKVKDIAVGPHLSHPEAITLDPTRARAYVPLANADAVAVVDTESLELAGELSVAVPEGAGSAPVSTAVTPDGKRLLVAHSAADQISVYSIENGRPSTLLGRIPTADYPTDVATAAGNCGAAAKSPGCPSTLLWTAAKGFGLGPNAGPPITDQYFDIPAALSTKGLVTGYAGIDRMPTNGELRHLTDRVSAQLQPFNAKDAPPDTPLRPDGPIKHVFYIVRENRTYDQVFGDEPRGDGDPSYAIFNEDVTPNAHALADRFPLLDRFYANSEASIDGHYWTAAATTSDYVHRTWRQNYAGRDYPSDAWFYQIAFPQTGLLFDRATEQGVSWANLGEGVAHLAPFPDRDRNAEEMAAVLDRFTHSDLGPLTGGCYDPFIGTNDLFGVPIRLYDSSKPAGAPEPSVSRFDCFASKFALWELTGTLPELVYMTLPNDHTNGASPNHHSPRAMVADNDRALGQVVDLISHSSYWNESAIFVLEDDSQDGFDHVDAHRIPAFVISPYAKQGAVVSTAYDMVAMIRSIELILGLPPMNLFDAQATPMYDAFTSEPVNALPFTALPSTYNLLEETPASPTSAAGRAGTKFDTTLPDRIPQHLLDRILWESVHGPGAEPPPPGPNAELGE
jgi:DNA-binding beta-propeller fold protein YncE